MNRNVLQYTHGPSTLASASLVIVIVIVMIMMIMVIMIMIINLLIKQSN